MSTLPTPRTRINTGFAGFLLSFLDSEERFKIVQVCLLTVHETVHRRISLNTQRPGHQCDVPGLFLIIFQFRNVCATFINVHLRVLLRGRYRRVTKHVLHRPSISSHPSQTCGRRFAMSRRLLFICQRRKKRKRSFRRKTGIGRNLPISFSNCKFALKLASSFS